MDGGGRGYWGARGSPRGSVLSSVDAGTAAALAVAHGIVLAAATPTAGLAAAGRTTATHRHYRPARSRLTFAVAYFSDGPISSTSISKTVRRSPSRVS